MSSCPVRKLILCYEILKNFGRLLTLELWKCLFDQWGFWKGLGLGLLITWAFIAAGIRDIISIFIVPDYPPKPERSEVNGVVKYFD